MASTIICLKINNPLETKYLFQKGYVRLSLGYYFSKSVVQLENIKAYQP